MVKQSGSGNSAPIGENKGEVILYQSADDVPSLEVRLEKESVWLNLNQIATLFERDKSVISRHLGNIFREGELEREPTVAIFATVQNEGERTVIRQVEYFNLDAILSVGYRVNSKRGTQFRIWATGILRKHLIEGYTANERRLKELRQTLSLVGNVMERYSVSSDEAQALLRVVTDYSGALDLLDDYDHKRVRASGGESQPATGVTYEEAMRIITSLRKHFKSSSLFGLEKDESLHSSLAAVMQTFDDKDVYPTLEDKAAHLLYFLVKNHSFADGNKRIAAALFLWFMRKNNILLKENGSRRIAENTLVAITLMIAESPPAERDTICRMVALLISEKA
jgi:prophage maintenance system killer protein